MAEDYVQQIEQAHRLIPSPTTRQRAGKLSRSKMLFIMVLFHLSPYKHFKAFYLYRIGHQHHACFGRFAVPGHTSAERWHSGQPREPEVVRPAGRGSG